MGFYAATILRSSKKEKLRKAGFSCICSSKEPITSTATSINRKPSTVTQCTNTDDNIATVSRNDATIITSAATSSQTESSTMTEGKNTENSTMEGQILKDATYLIEDLAFFVYFAQWCSYLVYCLINLRGISFQDWNDFE